jgi:hypothetical protein
MRMSEFTIERVSPAGDVPAITYEVRGDTMRAEMANGAKRQFLLDWYAHHTRRTP